MNNDILKTNKGCPHLISNFEVKNPGRKREDFRFIITLEACNNVVLIISCNCAAQVLAGFAKENEEELILLEEGPYLFFPLYKKIQ